MRLHYFVPYFNFVKWFFFFQLSFIGIHFFVVLLLTPLLNFLTKQKKSKIALLKERLLTLLHQKKPLRLPRFLRTPAFLIPTISELDAKKEWAEWNETRQSLFEQFLLPQAKKLTYSRRWLKRAEAVSCFLLFPDARNEPFLLHLLQDKIPAVQYGAAFAAARLGSSSCTNAIVDVMNHSKTRLLRHTFCEALLKGDARTLQHLEKRLESDADPATHISCLEVFSQQMNAHVSKLAQRDLQKTDKELRLTAIRALGHFREPKSIAALIPLLQDPEWEVRALAARSLGYLQAHEAVPELSQLLKDKIWWVRMNGALALKRLGKEGERALKSQNPQEDRFAYEIVQYVLPLSLDG